MKKFLLFFVAALFTLYSVNAQEQSVTAEQIAALNERIAELEGKVEAQKSRSEKWGKIVEKLPKISGIVKMGYTWTDEQDAETNEFWIQHVRLILSGDISKKFDYKLQFEFASPKLVDAYIRWKVNPAFNVQFGQFHVPFSLEGPLSPAKWETVESAPVVGAITGLPDTRDMGIDIYGQFLKVKERYLFDYAVGVFQGEGKNKHDANKSKDVIGRLKFFPIEELCLTGSYSYGERGEDYVVNQRAAAGLEYKGKAFSLRSEYLWHKQNGADGAAPVYQDGFYVVAQYKVKNFAPVVRYNFYNQKSILSQRSDYVVGLNYSPVKLLNFQLNYTLSNVAAAGVDNTSFNSVGFAAILSF